MKEMVLLEQFLETLPPEMRVRVMERKPSTAGAAAEIADDLNAARRYESESRPAASRADKLSRQTRSVSPTPPGRSFRVPPRSKTNTRGEVQCWACEGWGHIAANCPDKLNRGAGKPAGSGKVMFNQGQIKGAICVCPAVENSCPDGLNSKVMACKGQATMAAPCSPLLCSNFDIVKEGTLNSKKVKILLDTGSQTSVARADLVAKEKWDLETKMSVRCVHGDSAYYPTAVVQVGIDEVQKPMRVALIPGLPVDLLIGVNDFTLSGSREVPNNHNLMVMTRQQRRQQAIDRQNHQATAVTASPSPLVIAPVDNQPNKKEDISSTEAEDLPMEEANTPTGVQEEDVHNRSPDKQYDLHHSLQVTPEQMKLWQESDPSLEKLREATKDPQEGYTATFFYKRSLVYRRWTPKGKSRQEVEQLVLPVQCRSIVLRIGHDVPAAGHMGINKTKSRILRCYYWPGIFRDIAQYCKTCEVCQRSSSRNYKARMIPMPIITTPFQRIAMDIVGPLPRTRSGNKYILTICDYATRYPEAIPLPSTEAERIAKELVVVFSRMGIPKEILTDQGTNFMSTLLQEVYQLLNITRIRTSPYHPQTDGLVERFNGTLKSMMKKFTSKNQKDWDECLPYLLFAYREAIQESTGFAPFELMYGRPVRGPLEALKESWTGEEDAEPTKLENLSQIRERLEEMSKIVEMNMKKAQQKQKHFYDEKAKECALEVGDEVLVKIPTKKGKLKLEWEGPYRITKKVSSVNFEIETPGKKKEKKVYHVNLLKKWNANRSCAYSDDSGCENPQKSTCAEISLLALGDLHLEFLYGPLEPTPLTNTCAANTQAILCADTGITNADTTIANTDVATIRAANPSAATTSTTTISKSEQLADDQTLSPSKIGAEECKLTDNDSLDENSVKHSHSSAAEPNSCAFFPPGTADSEQVSDEAEPEQHAHTFLSDAQKADLQGLLQRFPDVLGEKLGRTGVVEHHIETEAQPIHQHPYRVPITMRETVEAELDLMLNLDIIQPSRSPWASPVILVEKKDGGVRFCVDYRKLNDVSKFDAYPMPRVEDVLEGVGSATIFSTLDLCKGYWQVPMEEKSREKTAFTTPFGLFEFKVMPFGLHNAPATFQRMMNEVLKECQEFAKAYIDDIVIFSSTWEEHLDHLDRVFRCLQKAGLTLKESKCQFGLSHVYYLGYLIGGGGIQPDPKKIEAVLAYKQPETKSEVSAFLGFTEYYRKFVPSYATIAAPLTELLKKGKPERVIWNAACAKAFGTLKECLTKAPILRVLDPRKSLIVQTDASDVGIGAVLSQVNEGGEEHPITYASRKLQPQVFCSREGVSGHSVGAEVFQILSLWPGIHHLY